MDNEIEYRWLQFEKLIDLHKFYFENLIKAASFSFGIIGAILTYALSAKASPHVFRLALSLPFLLSIGSFLMFAFGAWKTWDLHKSIMNHKKRLSLNWRPHAETLVFMSILFALLFLIVTMGLGVLILHPALTQK